MKGGYISTFSGGIFHPLDPQPAEVRIEDIAHALSMLCRFTGHVSRFYSVAEHSVIVSRLVPERYALAGLLHDAAEAYLNDLSTPVKHDPRMKLYCEAEDRLRRVIFQHFGLQPELPAPVHAVDQLLVIAEARALFASAPVWTKDVPSLGGDQIVGFDPGDAEVIFLERLKEIKG